MSEPEDSIINEVNRITLLLPERESSFYSSEFLAIAIDQLAEGTAHHLLRYIPGRLSFMGYKAVISTLCNDRAQRCVDGRLLVEGRPIKPERYIPLWREALQKAVSLKRFCEANRSQITAVITGVYAEMQTRRYQHPSEPFYAFEQIEAHYQQRLQHFADGSFVLKINLLEPAALDHISLIDELANREPKARFSIDIEMQTQETLAATQFTMFPEQESVHVVSD